MEINDATKTATITNTLLSAPTATDMPMTHLVDCKVHNNSSIPDFVDRNLLDKLYQDRIFEHFLVVGASPEKAADAAKKMEVDHQSFTSKLMKRIGTYMRSSSTSNSRHNQRHQSYHQNQKSQSLDNCQQDISRVSPSTLPQTQSSIITSSTVSNKELFQEEISEKLPKYEDMNSATSFGVPPYVEDTTSRSLILDTRDHATSTTGTDISDEVWRSNVVEENVPTKRTFLSYFSSSPRTPKLSPHTGSKKQLSSRPNLQRSAHSTSSVDHKAFKNEIYSDSIEPSLLYHYPLNGPTPPKELCDFCMPMSCRLHHITDDFKMEEIFYGHRQSKRSGRSFTFMLENKAMVSSSSSSSTNTASSSSSSPGCVLSTDGLHSDSRLYGFCVINSRYLNLYGYDDVIPPPASSHTTSPMETKRSSKASSSDHLTSSLPRSYDFEAPVCYSFLSRYPFHEFFFQIIYQMIDVERMARMEMMSMLTESSHDYEDEARIPEKKNFIIERQIYSYVQRSILEEILEKLLNVKPPLDEGVLKFQMSETSRIIEYRRRCIYSDYVGLGTHIYSLSIAEHSISSAEWSLPVLLSWMPLNTLVWVLGLTLCESKVIVLGSEVGMVSCSVMGLLALIHPLKWVAPLIPILPVKHFEFVESPVPLIAGLVIDAYDRNVIDADSILKLCNDEDNGTITIVLDVYEREVYIANCNASVKNEMLLPGAEALIRSLRASHPKEIASTDDNNASSKSRKSSTQPVYAVSNNQIEFAKAIQKSLHQHLQTIIEMACTKQLLLQQAASCDLSGANRDRLFLHSGSEINLSHDSESADNVVSIKKRSLSERSFFDRQDQPSIRRSFVKHEYDPRKSMNVQIKSLKWTEIGGIIIGDGIGSNTMSTNWITSQLNALELTPHSVVPRRHVFDSDDDDSDDDDDDGTSRKAILSEHTPTVSSLNEMTAQKSTKKSSRHRSNLDLSSSFNDLTILTKICEVTSDNQKSSPSTDLKLLSNCKSFPRSSLPPSEGKDDSFDKNSNSGITIESASRSERTAISSNQVTKVKMDDNCSGTIVSGSFSAVALSDQPLNSDVDAFIGRFSSTQLFAEYLSWTSNQTNT